MNTEKRLRKCRGAKLHTMHDDLAVQRSRLDLVVNLTGISSFMQDKHASLQQGNLFEAVTMEGISFTVNEMEKSPDLETGD